MVPKGNLVGPKEPQERPKLLGIGFKMASKRPPDNPRWPQDGVSVLGVVSRRPSDGHLITRDSPRWLLRWAIREEDLQNIRFVEAPKPDFAEKNK